MRSFETRATRSPITIAADTASARSSNVPILEWEADFSKHLAPHAPSILGFRGPDDLLRSDDDFQERNSIAESQSKSRSTSLTSDQFVYRARGVLSANLVGGCHLPGPNRHLKQVIVIAPRYSRAFTFQIEPRSGRGYGRRNPFILRGKHSYHGTASL